MPSCSLQFSGSEMELTFKGSKSNFRKNLPTLSNLVRNISDAFRVLNLKKHSKNSEHNGHTRAE